MSEATKEALDQALQAHIADEGEGHLVTGYALIAVGINHDNLTRESNNYFTEFADGQPYHSSVGLATYLIDVLRDGRFDEEDDDD